MNDNELIPAFKGRGIYHILEWYTHNKGSHIIVSRSLDSMIKSGLVIFDEYRDVEFRSYWLIDVVLPPENLRDEYRQQAYENNVYNFKMHTTMDIENIYKDTGLLPKSCVICNNYTRTTRSNRWDNVYHCCELCKDKNPITYTGSWEALYDLQNVRNPPLSLEGTGKATNPNEKLYGAILDSGHHCNGIMIKEINSIDDLYPRSLLFFNGESLTVPSELTKLKAAVKKQEKKNEALERKEREAAQAARELEERKKIEKMFGEFVNPNA